MRKQTALFIAISLLLCACGESEGVSYDDWCTEYDCAGFVYDGKDAPDADGDTVPDEEDNCLNVPNPDQLDEDKNGIGDACDIFDVNNGGVIIDTDSDTIPDDEDNCYLVYNPKQEDKNKNGIGDACEENTKPIIYDADGDTISDKTDNCPYVYNEDQADSDGDGIGDECEDNQNIPDDKNDADGDTIPDDEDNCPYVSNANQKDSNQNGTGDACELTMPDDDGDTIPNAEDNCPDVPNPDQADKDKNNIGDACEKSKDTDGDTILDEFDNCIYVPNPDQADEDSNGIGDACDNLPDADGDSIPDKYDNCKNVKNPGQEDFNNDGSGDACATGTPQDPFVIPVTSGFTSYQHSADTKESNISKIDKYPGYESKNETGPEYYYVFTVKENVQLNLWLDPEPSGVDIDPHLLSSIDPVTLIQRNDKAITATLTPGTYWIVMDTYNGAKNAGKYTLNVTLTAIHSGTKTDPIPIGSEDGITPSFNFVDSRSTANATSSVFNTYPGYTNFDESGKEFIYKFKLNTKARFHATLRAPEPTGVDIDLHLLSDLNPTVVARSDYRIWKTLEPGTYYLVADTFGTKHGKYVMDVQFRPVETSGDIMFNDYIIEAVNYIDGHYRLKGYKDSAFTHNLPYGNEIVKASNPPYTMCVAAVTEVILTAMHLYAEDTGDNSVWNHLDVSSWNSLAATNIRAHIWVNHTIKAGGTGDALSLFGMGMTVPFKELVPGSFVNLNRTSKSGHATTFLAFIDANAVEYKSFPSCNEVSQSCIIGFKYYSSQGSATNGGFDYRYAIFDGMTLKNNPSGIRKDTGVIYNPDDQDYLNTAIIYHPHHWLKTSLVQGVVTPKLKRDMLPEELYSTFDAEYFKGKTSGDNE